MITDYLPPKRAHICTYITPSSRFFPEKLTVATLLKILPALHVSRRLITIFNRPLPSETNPDHALQSYLLKIHFNIIHPVTPSSWSGLFPSGFSARNLYTFLSTLMRTTCPAHLILINLITPIIFGETWQSRSSPFVSFLTTSPYSLLLRSKYLPQHPVLEHFQSTFFLQCERPRFTSTQSNVQSYSVVY